ncbi:MAG: bifunctional folylpolyglutamate synthase/dihydrofolate synthase [Clostridia bacterium]|nr:bifunctional folylpolyglutamate synthase/dihydrofolate synthase [Clostridia bacterium]
MTGEERLSLAEKRLGTYPRFSAVPGTENVSALLGAMGDPHKKMRYVHVAGTNGKGSTTSMIATALTAAGYRTGLYTSPSVERLTERVCIDMAEADSGDFASALDLAMDSADRKGISPAQFDLLTAAAFYLFEKSGCEIVCAEVGLGGRLDATNVIENTEVAVITSISADHVAQLGSDLGGIAREKCGILKGGCPVVVYPCQPQEAMNAICACAKAEKSELVMPDLAALTDEKPEAFGTEFVYRGVGYKLNMPGRHFVMNAITAIEAIKVLARRGLKLTDEHTVRGVAAAPLTGRLQTLLEDPVILADGAHNPDAAQKLCRAISELFGDRRIITVMGMYSDKDYVPCVEAVAELSDVFLATEPDGSRARSAVDIWSAARGRAKSAYICPSVRSAIVQAVSFWRPGDVIICCGSFGLAGAAKKALAKYGPYISQFTK